MTTLAHRHSCPSCYRRPLCREDCTTEIDDDGARRGGTVLCDRCAALSAPPSAEQQLAELRAAVAQALGALGAESEIYGCGECGIRVSDGTLGALHLCDKCAKNALVRLDGAPYAPALRRLRALIGEEG